MMSTISDGLSTNGFLMFFYYYFYGITCVPFPYVFLFVLDVVYKGVVCGLMCLSFCFPSVCVAL